RPRAAAAWRRGTPAVRPDRSGVPCAAALLQRTYYVWFLRVVRCRYSLSAAGTAALIDYAAIADISAGKL
ncbi:hypothetical protein AMQ83_26350, partial [Paenibacillus riograndensis]